MNDLCLWSLVVAACVLVAPVLVCVIAAAMLSGELSEQERKREWK